MVLGDQKRSGLQENTEKLVSIESDGDKFDPRSLFEASNRTSTEEDNTPDDDDMIRLIFAY